MSKSSVKQLAPAIMFCIAMGFVGTVFVLGNLPTGTVLCHASDGSNIVCVRNWINAAGNSGALIIAIVAAYFAHGQMKAARKQAAIALIPTLAETYKASRKLRSAVYECTLHMAIINSILKEMIACAKNDESSGALLLSFCESLNISLEALYNSIDEISKLEVDEYYFSGVEEIFSDIHVKSKMYKFRCVAFSGIITSLIQKISPQKDLTLRGFHIRISMSEIVIIENAYQSLVSLAKSVDANYQKLANITIKLENIREAAIAE